MSTELTRRIESLLSAQLAAGTATSSSSSSPSVAPSSPSPSRNINNDRLSYLYSEFSRGDNPSGCSTNVRWWSCILADIARLGLQSPPDHLVLHANVGLLDHLRRPGLGRPMAMGYVLSQLIKNHVIFSVTSFLSAKKPLSLSSSHSLSKSSSISSSTSPSSSLSSSASSFSAASWTSWLFSSLVSQPILSVASSLDIIDPSKTAPSSFDLWSNLAGDYIVVDLLETAANAILLSYEQCPQAHITDRLYSVASFTDFFASKALPNTTLTSKDIDVLLLYLCRDRRVLSYQGNVIKFFDPITKSADPIDKTDENIVHVKETIWRMELQVEQLDSRIEECLEKAKVSVQAGKPREKTRAILAHKARLRSMWDYRSQCLSTLQEVLLRIEQTSGDMETMQAYEMATASLRGLLSSPLLQRDRVHNTLEEMADALTNQAEIDDALRQPMDVSSSADYDEEELAKELNQLAREQQVERMREREKQEKEEKEKQLQQQQQKLEEEERQRREKSEKEDKDLQNKELLERLSNLKIPNTSSTSSAKQETVEGQGQKQKKPTEAS